ncbi:hypothetical protein LJC19_02190 [Oxalobacter sp. OttesenSCG-928-P03]|nr:hypothetical protein [Oxalobacter sp. OttesenSCG-928-P03]
MRQSRLFFMPFLAVAAFLALAGNVCAQNTSKPLMGAQTCQRWTQSIKEAEDEKTGLMSSRFTVMANQNWVFGYASGLNAATAQKNNLLEDLDQQTLSDWVSQYCETNPEKSVTDAIHELFRRLGRKI